MTAEFALAADINPGTTGTNDSAVTPETTSSSRETKQGNSNNHDEDGQNVLYADGHVEFVNQPFVGVQRDNIYTARFNTTTVLAGASNVTTLYSPYDAMDSVLLPTDD